MARYIYLNENQEEMLKSILEKSKHPRAEELLDKLKSNEGDYVITKNDLIKRILLARPELKRISNKFYTMSNYELQKFYIDIVEAKK